MSKNTKKESKNLKINPKLKALIEANKKKQQAEMPEGTFPKVSMIRSLYEKVMNRVKKRGMWFIFIDKMGRWSMVYEQTAKNQTEIILRGERYIIDHECIMQNKKHGGLIMYYNTNPQPIKPVWTESRIGKDDILVTSDGLNQFMLQKIWGDFLGDLLGGLDIKKILMYGGVGIVVFYMLQNYIF